MRKILLIALALVLCVASSANSETLFSEDFEDGLSDLWVFSERGGQGDWNVVEQGGNHILQKTGTSWTIIRVDGVGGVDGGKEVWATARIRCDIATADEGTEIGLLIDPATSNGNWYFTVRAQSSQAGFDELAVGWHDMVPYPDWSVGDWYRIKVAVIDSILYGKIWVDGGDEPADWTSQTLLTTHLDQDGVGFASDTNELSFDDLIVADVEADLAAAVDPQAKLSVTWGKVKHNSF